MSLYTSPLYIGDHGYNVCFALASMKQPCEQTHSIFYHALIAIKQQWRHTHFDFVCFACVMPDARIDYESALLEDGKVINRIRESPQRDIPTHTWQLDNFNKVYL